ncbi:MAG: sulfur oxidation c-type cytochrome SoxX [Hyphomicrobiaceae bacterium]
MRRGLRLRAAMLLLGAVLLPATASTADRRSEGVVAAEAVVVGDGIPAPLTTATASPERGREVVRDRERGNCEICHALPEAGAARFQGDVGPPLAGVGRRLSVAQLRLRLVDGARINPQTIMPSYHRVTGLARVAAAYRGRPVLTAQEIEDAVAYLATLRDEK